MLLDICMIINSLDIYTELLDVYVPLNLFCIYIYDNT